MRDELVIVPKHSAKWILRPFKTRRLHDSEMECAAEGLKALVAAGERLLDGLAPFDATDVEALRRGDAPPERVLRALRNYIDLIRAGTAPDGAPHWSCWASLWGEQFRIGLGWHWHRLKISTYSSSAIVAPNAAYVLLPNNVRHMLAPEGSPNSVALLYNMVAADPGTDGKLKIVS
jgi:hypothetical protein